MFADDIRYDSPNSRLVHKKEEDWFVLLKRISMASVGVMAAVVGIGLKPMMMANANADALLVASNGTNLSNPKCRTYHLDPRQSGASHASCLAVSGVCSGQRGLLSIDESSHPCHEIKSQRIARLEGASRLRFS